jgi:hypothetical protein
METMRRPRMAGIRYFIGSNGASIDGKRRLRKMLDAGVPRPERGFAMGWVSAI